MNFQLTQTNKDNLTESEYQDIKLIEKLNKITIPKFSVKLTRPSQQNFRNELISYFTKCPITGCEVDECEAAHIIPVGSDGDYVLTNGLLLGAHIHKTFDKFAWSINPETLQIEYTEKSGSICKYVQQINLSLILDHKWKKSLEWHYSRYKIKN
jgi:predicted restriction endonuclease